MTTIYYRKGSDDYGIISKTLNEDNKQFSSWDRPTLKDILNKEYYDKLNYDGNILTERAVFPLKILTHLKDNVKAIETTFEPTKIDEFYDINENDANHILIALYEKVINELYKDKFNFVVIYSTPSNSFPEIILSVKSPSEKINIDDFVKNKSRVKATGTEISLTRESSLLIGQYWTKTALDEVLNRVTKEIISVINSIQAKAKE